MKTVFIAAALLGLSACGVDSSESSQSFSENEITAEGINTQKARQSVKVSLIDMPEGENSIYSQASVDGLLALLGGGYGEENQKLLESYLGKSLSEATKKSGTLQVEKEGILIKSANNLWARPYFGVKKTYLDYLDKGYNGLKPGVLNVNPSLAASDVNDWAAENTNDMIKEVVSADMLGPEIVMILANALYFKGEWENKFDSQHTRKSDFNIVTKKGEKSVAQVDTMHKFQNKISMKHLSAEDAGLDHDVTVVRLPYRGDEYAMYITFASKLVESAFSFDTTVETAANVTQVYAQMIAGEKAFAEQWSKKEFAFFSMPKFTIESKFSSIEGPLKQIGLSPLFQRGALSQLSDDSRAELSFILQKAKIIVNEEGSEAAAVTVGGVRTTSIGPKSSTLKIDGPFAYAIQDEKNKVTLFEGIVRKPETKEDN